MDKKKEKEKKDWLKKAIFLFRKKAKTNPLFLIWENCISIANNEKDRIIKFDEILFI